MIVEVRVAWPRPHDWVGWGPGGYKQNHVVVQVDFPHRVGRPAPSQATFACGQEVTVMAYSYWRELEDAPRCSECVAYVESLRYDLAVQKFEVNESC